MTRLRTVGVIAACLAGGGAVAQTPPAMPKVREVCAADFQKLCPDATPGHGAIAQCVRGHVQELSPDCKSALMARREAMRQRKAAMANSASPEQSAGAPPPN